MNRSPSLFRNVGSPKLFFEHRPQGDSAAEAGQIAQVADDARRIIDRAGKGEADRHRRRGATGADLRETLDDVGQTAA